tara:strand:- start:188 stop:685 length:498 start_codon:yes stop_codon:yes gene_type:complete
VFIKYVLTFFLSLGLLLPSNTPEDWSRSKQQKFFPKTLKKKDIYLGMSLEKLQKECPNAIAISQSSEFKIEYTEASQIPGIISYTYLLTKTAEPKLYQIAIHYKEMEGVQARAEALLGKPNHQGEWRMPAKEIKEYFDMGVWTFGHKWVYGATLTNSEWEKGFQN